MKSFTIQSRQIFFATWTISTRVVRRLDCRVKVFKLARLVACLLAAAGAAQGQDPLVIDPDGTVKINGVVIAPDGTVNINGTVITPDGTVKINGIVIATNGKVTINGMVIEPSGNATINGSLKLAGIEGPATAGMIRWTGSDFEGYDGKKWLTLTASATPLEHMVWIPPGEFVSKFSLKALITEGFWMGQYEVTQKEYEALIGSNPSHFKGNEKRPVESVSWNDAAIYCAKLTIRESEAGKIPVGYEYRLPTSAEWEYAFLAGKTAKQYSFGDDEKQLGDYDWFKGNSGGTTHAVGEKKQNEWGLYDMHGNVSEWCQDYDYWSFSKLQVNPKVPATGNSRLYIGGNFGNDALRCKLTWGGVWDPSVKEHDKGFRIVLAPRQP